MEKLLLVAAGGALGTGCRYALSSLVYAHIDRPTFPWANLLVNVTGSFAIGVLAQIFDARLLVSPTARAVLLTGVLGGYTTFSSFAYETLALLRDGEYVSALLNAGGNLALGLLAVWLGIRLVQLVT
jgi:fluoride exporter